MRNASFIFFCTIIGLALFGIVFQLTTNPFQFFGSIVTTILVAAAILLIMYFLFVRPKRKGNQMSKYKQAVKQSKKKYGETDRRTEHKRSSAASTLKSRKKASHLRVIEGNKSKKNNRATF